MKELEYLLLQAARTNNLLDTEVVELKGRNQELEEDNARLREENACIRQGSLKVLPALR